MGLTLAVICAALVYVSCRPERVTNASLSDNKRYSLFTWDANRDQVCFALVPRPRRDSFLRRWFPKRGGKCGIVELKNELKKLPKDTEVLWEELPRRGFTYPSADILDDIKESAKKEGIDVVNAPILG